MLIKIGLWPDQSYEMKNITLVLQSGFKIVDQLKIEANDLKKEEIEDIFIFVKYRVV